MKLMTKSNSANYEASHKQVEVVCQWIGEMTTYDIVHSANFVLDSSTDEEDDSVYEAAQQLIKKSNGRPLQLIKPKEKKRFAENNKPVKKKFERPSLPSDDEPDMKAEDINLNELEELEPDDFFFTPDDVIMDKNGQTSIDGWAAKMTPKNHDLESGIEFDSENFSIKLNGGKKSHMEESSEERPKQFERNAPNKSYQNNNFKRNQMNRNNFQNNNFNNKQSRNFCSQDGASNSKQAEYDEFVKRNLNTKAPVEKKFTLYTSEEIPSDVNFSKRQPLPTSSGDPNGFRSNRGSRRGRGRGNFNNEKQVFSMSNINSKRPPLETFEDDLNGFRSSRGSRRGRGRGRGNFNNEKQVFSMSNINSKRPPLETFEDDPNGFQAYRKKNKRGRW